MINLSRKKNTKKFILSKKSLDIKRTKKKDQYMKKEDFLEISRKMRLFKINKEKEK